MAPRARARAKDCPSHSTWQAGCRPSPSRKVRWDRYRRCSTYPCRYNHRMTKRGKPKPMRAFGALIQEAIKLGKRASGFQSTYISAAVTPIRPHYWPAGGCHSSTLLPSGSMTQANFPYSDSSIFSATLHSSSRKSLTRVWRSSTR